MEQVTNYSKTDAGNHPATYKINELTATVNKCLL